MCNLPNMTEADLEELSQCRKEKLKKKNVATSDWVELEWEIVDVHYSETLECSRNVLAKHYTPQELKLLREK